MGPAPESVGGRHKNGTYTVRQASTRCVAAWVLARKKKAPLRPRGLRFGLNFPVRARVRSNVRHLQNAVAEFLPEHHFCVGLDGPQGVVETKIFVGIGRKHAAQLKFV